ncbi:hypothetical protein ACFQY7_32050 [Actinomadura luteofluorescens]|uniref:hypothetical protein n=1 Tax=Actinomadura luteofluorescens TaxID=46163 RepID=UPI003641BD8C
MSDQGERSVRWTEMSESEPRDGADGTTGPQAAFPEPKVPEVPVPPPTGRTDFSAGEGAGTHDVWGKVETRRPEPAASEEPDPEDVKVAPVAEEAPQWEGSLFEEGDDDGGGDDKYVPAVPTGSGQPAKPGKPSSGNWQMPDWMADESAADAKLGGSPKPERDVLDGGGGRSRLVLFGGIGLLVVALLAAAACTS